MIRINLLSPERTRTSRRASGLQIGQKVTLACSLILIVTTVGVVWTWWSLDRASARLDGDLLSAQRETVRLRSLIQQVETFEKQKQQLQQRVVLIEELRKGQSAPVHMLDEISRALPEMLWLTELKQDASGELTIEGRCVTLTSLSDLVGNLEGSGQFKRPVEILDSQVEPGTASKGELIKFSIKAQYASPGAPAAPAKADVTRARAR
jgi:type IV pilus assembly protein PilN